MSLYRDIWPFLRVLYVLSLDLASASGQTEAIIKSLLTHTSGKPVEAGIAEATWDALLRVAAEGMSEARSYQHENLPEELRQRHTQHADTKQHALRALSEHAMSTLDAIRSTIGDVHLDRTLDPGAIYEAVDKFERLSQKTNDQITAGFAEMDAMKVELQTIANFIATQTEQPDSELYTGLGTTDMVREDRRRPRSNSARVDRHGPDTVRGDRARSRTVARQP